VWIRRNDARVDLGSLATAVGGLSLNAIQINSTPTSPTHGGSTYTPSATATSGDPVIITSATPSVCTVSGGVVTFKMAGQCTLNFNDPAISTSLQRPKCNRI